MTDLEKMNLKQLKELRAERLEEMKYLVDLGKDEKRELNAEESRKFNQAEREITVLDTAIIERSQKEESAKRSIERGEGVPQGDGMYPRTTVESEWRDAITGKPVRVLKRDQKLTETLSYNEQGMSLGRVVRAMILGDHSQLNEEEKRALTSGPTSGGVLIPTSLSARVIDLAREQSVIMKAGAQTVDMASNNLTLAKVSDSETDQIQMGWKAENAKFVESGMAFEPLTLTAHTLGGIVRLSRELVADAANITSVVEKAMAQALADEIDRVAWEGTGLNDQPLGLLNTPGIITNPATGSITDWNKFIDAWVQILENNGNPNAYVISPAMAGRLQTLVAGADGQYLAAPPAIAKLQQLIAKKVTGSRAIIGDFTNLLFGIRQGMMLEITDKGGFEVFERHQVAIKLSWRGDLAVTQPNHFAVMDGITL